MTVVLEHVNELCSDRQQGCHILALHHHLLDGIPVDRTYYLLLVITFFLEIGSKDLGELHRMTLTCGEVELHTVAADVLEQCLYISLAHAVAGDSEA